jgi:hypothetical protein
MFSKYISSEEFNLISSGSNPYTVSGYECGLYNPRPNVALKDTGEFGLNWGFFEVKPARLMPIYYILKLFP